MSALARQMPPVKHAQVNGIDMAYYEVGPRDGVSIIFCHGFPEPLLFFLVHDSHALVSPDQLQQPLSFGRIVFDHYMCHSGQVFNSS